MKDKILNRRNLTLDLYRIVAAALILLIHTSMISDGNGVHYNSYYFFIAISISRFCVPIFMVITGYYFFKNPTLMRKKRTLKSIIWLWGIWLVVYSPVGLYKLFKLPFEQALKAILEVFFQSSLSYGGSWYLVAVFWGIVIVDYLRKKRLMVISVVISVIISILDCLNSTYYNLFSPFSNFAKPGEFCLTFLTGIVWITLSYYISKYSDALIKKCTNWLVLIISIGLPISEFLILYTIVPNYPLHSNNGATESFLTLPIAVTCIFAFLIGHPIYINRQKAIYFRNIATLMYFIQFGIVNISIHLFKYVGSINLLFWVDLFTVVLLSNLIFLISKCGFLTWLRLLYTAPLNSIITKKRI